MASHGIASVVPSSGVACEKSALRSSYATADPQHKGKTKRVQILPPAEDETIAKRSLHSSSSSDSDHCNKRTESPGISQKPSKKRHSRKKGKRFHSRPHQGRERECSSEDIQEGGESDWHRGDNSDCNASHFGGVQVAIRVRPLLENELMNGENLCAAVFHADNRKADQRVRTFDTISLWNASKRAESETVGGRNTTLRLLHRVLPREIGTEHSVLTTVPPPQRRGFPVTPAAAAPTRESWWSQHLTSTSSVSSSTVTSGEHIVKDFHFPIVLGPRASQEDAYRCLQIKRYCDAAYEGKAAAVMCFGQTGSGKTYTISGPGAYKAGESVREPSTQGANPDSPQGTPPTNRSVNSDSGGTGENRGQLADDKDGIQYRAVSYFMGSRLRAARSAGNHVRVQASYVEVYNEKVNDLLQGRNNLPMHYHQSAQLFFLEGLMMVECENEDDVRLVLEEGQRHRQQAAHMLNDNSSRSHTIFTLYVEVREEGAGNASASRTASEMFDDEEEEGEDEDRRERNGGGASKRNHRNRGKKKTSGSGNAILNGKLSFVDLAGAERLKETGSEGEDAKSINKSLFALGSVLEKLSQQHQPPPPLKLTPAGEQWKRGWLAGGGFTAPSNTAESTSTSSPSLFIPYRSSVLTKLLMDTLSGSNCSQLLFIACITPASRFYEESIKTLYYAQRASDVIRTPPAAAALGGKMSGTSLQILQLTERMRALEKENRLFRQMLRLPLRGILGEENIRHQVHQLIQQRGTGQHSSAVSNTCAKPSLPPPPPPPGILPISATMTGGAVGDSLGRGGAPAPYCYPMRRSVYQKEKAAALIAPNDTPVSTTFSPSLLPFSGRPSSYSVGPPCSSSLEERNGLSPDESSEAAMRRTTSPTSVVPPYESNLLKAGRERTPVSPSFAIPGALTSDPVIMDRPHQGMNSHRDLLEVIVNMEDDTDDEENEGESGMNGRHSNSGHLEPRAREGDGGRCQGPLPSTSSPPLREPPAQERNDTEGRMVMSSLHPRVGGSFTSKGALPSVPSLPGSSPSPCMKRESATEKSAHSVDGSSSPRWGSSSYTCMGHSSEGWVERGTLVTPASSTGGVGDKGRPHSFLDGVRASLHTQGITSPPIQHPMITASRGVGVEGDAAQRGWMERKTYPSRRIGETWTTPETSVAQKCDRTKETLLPTTGAPSRTTLLALRPSSKASAPKKAAPCSRDLHREGKGASVQKLSNRPALPPPPSALIAKAPGGRSALDILNELPDL